MSIRLGIQLHPQHTTYGEMAQAALQADELGFDTLFTWDHFYPLYGTADAPFGPDLPEEARNAPEHGGHFEGWSLLAAFAAITKRIEIGMLVSCNTYRNPQLLADIARTVDHISHGRCILGIGSGWFEKDYTEYGYEFGTAGSRLKELDKAMPQLMDRLSKLHPQPVRNPMPILIGGGGEKLTLRMVAQYATIWNFFGTPQEIAHKMAVLDDWCAKVGRNPAEIERSILFISPDQLDHLDAYYEVGIRHFIYGFGKPFDFAPAKRLQAWREQRLATV
jgi:probable F420-dependent oxidoreductase